MVCASNGLPSSRVLQVCLLRPTRKTIVQGLVRCSKALVSFGRMSTISHKALSVNWLAMRAHFRCFTRRLSHRFHHASEQLCPFGDVMFEKDFIAFLMESKADKVIFRGMIRMLSGMYEGEHARNWEKYCSTWSTRRRASKLTLQTAQGRSRTSGVLAPRAGVLQQD